MEDRYPTKPATSPAPSADQPAGGSRGRWLMVACCIPMLVIAGVVAFSGAGRGFFFVAIGCTLMMVLMMSAMTGGDDTPPDDRYRP